MEREKIITTRELLRDFKVIRELLISKKVDSIIIPSNGAELEIKVKIKPKTGADVVEALKHMKPLKIKRDPNLFNDLLRYSGRISA